MNIHNKAHSLEITNLGIGLIFSAIGLVIYLLIPSAIRVNPELITYGVGPSFFAKFTSMLMMILGVTLVTVAAFKKDSPLFKFEVALRQLVYMVILVFYIISMQYLGFLVASILCIALSMFYWGARKWYVVLVISVAVPFMANYLFRTLAYVPLPRGIFF